MEVTFYCQKRNMVTFETKKEKVTKAFIFGTLNYKD
jgi:hypothetical protein